MLLKNVTSSVETKNMYVTSSVVPQCFCFKCKLYLILDLIINKMTRST